MITQQEMVDSLEFVVKNSKYVSIHQNVVDQYVADFVPTAQNHWTKSYPLGSLPNLSFEDNLNFFFLIGSQAFCFWGYPEKWTIEYQDKKLDGWWALVACFHRAIENGTPILTGKYLKTLTDTQARQLFTGSPEIPLFNERVNMLRSIGQALNQKYDGSFANCFKQTGSNAFDLLRVITSDFSGFDDIPSYKGKPVYFFKKAQVIISDINELSPLKGISLLPGHADYKIPAILRKMKMMQYDSELSRLVDSRTEIPSGSEMETEIRANMLWTLSCICDRLNKRSITIDPSTLGGILWVQSQTKSVNDKPYHLTKTIYY